MYYTNLLEFPAILSHLYFYKAFYIKHCSQKAGSEELYLTTNIFSLELHLFSPSQDTS